MVLNLSKQIVIKKSSNLKNKDAYQGDTEVKFCHNYSQNIQQLAKIKTCTYSCLVLNLSKQIVIKKSPNLKNKDAYQGDTELKFCHNYPQNIQLAKIKTCTYSCLVLNLSKQIVIKKGPNLKTKDAYQGDTELKFCHNYSQNTQQLAKIKTNTYSCLVLNLSKQIVIKKSPNLKNKDAYQGDTEVKFCHNYSQNIQQLAEIKTHIHSCLVLNSLK